MHNIGIYFVTYISDLAKISLRKTCFEKQKQQHIKSKKIVSSEWL